MLGYFGVGETMDGVAEVGQAPHGCRAILCGRATWALRPPSTQGCGYFKEAEPLEEEEE